MLIVHFLMVLVSVVGQVLLFRPFCVHLAGIALTGCLHVASTILSSLAIRSCSSSRDPVIEGQPRETSEGGPVEGLVLYPVVAQVMVPLEDRYLEHLRRVVGPP